jgi:hypothetical protein
MACGLEHGFECRQYVPWVRLNAACSDLQEAYQQCLGSGDECVVVGLPDAQGHWECDTYSGGCFTSPQPARCSCGRGSHMGTTFTDDGKSSIEEQIRRHCK